MTVPRASLQCAVSSVEAICAETGSVGTHAMRRAPNIAFLDRASFPMPVVIADTDSEFAVAIFATILITFFFDAVFTREILVTVALLCLYIKDPMSGAVGETLPLVVHSSTAMTFPAFPTHAGSSKTKTMTRTTGVLAVHLIAEVPFETRRTKTLSINAVSMIAAVRNLTLIVTNRALCSLPSWIASAAALFILSIVAAQ